MDLQDTLNELSEHMDCTHWTVEGFEAHPDLKGFSEQSTEMKLLPTEFVMQQGDGDYGFSGIILFPTEYSNGDGGKLFLKIEFCG